MTALVVILVVLVVVAGVGGYRVGEQREADSWASLDLGSADEAEEQRTLQMLELLQDAADHIDQAVMVRDADGNEVFRNAAARDYSEARHSLVLVEAAVSELLADALRGETVRRELDLFGPPGQSFILKASPLDGAGIPGALAIVEDVTLNKRTETVRRDFVANISHELKSPVGAMGLLAEMIRDEPDQSVVSRLAGRMVNEAERTNNTIDDLLELSRIEFGDETEFADVELRSVVDDAIDRISAAVDHAGITVDVDVDPGLTVVGDRLQLVSAVYNLLDNAVKYSSEGSVVSVTAKELGNEGGAELSVVDTGIGIPRKDLDRVFERFYRVDRARSRGTGGTGLGLAIVRHVANNHSGKVAAESIEGVGTTFTLSLPRSVQATTPPSESGQ